MFKTPSTRKSFGGMESEEPPPAKRGRTSEDFLMFCKMILDYENYEETRDESLRRRHASSPLGSTGSGDSVRSGEEDVGESPRNINRGSDVDTDDDSLDQVTCYCRKPFGGRPMIECSSCLTWVHLSCAKVKRTAIPDTWYCAMCKTKSTKNRRNSQAKSRRRKIPTSMTRKSPSAMSSASSSKSDGSSSILGNNIVVKRDSKNSSSATGSEGQESSSEPPAKRKSF